MASLNDTHNTNSTSRNDTDITNITSNNNVTLSTNPTLCTCTTACDTNNVVVIGSYFVGSIGFLLFFVTVVLWLRYFIPKKRLDIAQSSNGNLSDTEQNTISTTKKKTNHYKIDPTHRISNSPHCDTNTYDYAATSNTGVQNHKKSNDELISSKEDYIDMSISQEKPEIAIESQSNVKPNMDLDNEVSHQHNRNETNDKTSTTQECYIEMKPGQDSQKTEDHLGENCCENNQTNRKNQSTSETINIERATKERSKSVTTSQSCRRPYTFHEDSKSKKFPMETRNSYTNVTFNGGNNDVTTFIEDGMIYVMNTDKLETSMQSDKEYSTVRTKKLNLENSKSDCLERDSKISGVDNSEIPTSDETYENVCFTVENES